MKADAAVNISSTAGQLRFSSAKSPKRLRSTFRVKSASYTVSRDGYTINDRNAATAQVQDKHVVQHGQGGPCERDAPGMGHTPPHPKLSGVAPHEASDRRGGGGVLDPKVCVPKRARQDFPNGKFYCLQQGTSKRKKNRIFERMPSATKISFVGAF